jgi:hypothetical protein
MKCFQKGSYQRLVDLKRSRSLNVSEQGFSTIKIGASWQPNRRREVPSSQRMSYLLGAMFTIGLIGCHAALASEGRCYQPLPKTDSSSALFVEPKSKVCKAFEKELNASCGVEIPLVNLTPKVRSSRLSEPHWADIPLYDQKGNALDEGFALLSRLVRSRAMATYSVDRAARATRDEDAVTAAVRQARAEGKLPTLQRTSIDLVGAGQREDMYRLRLGARNPRSLLEANSGKSEPQLFLARAEKFANTNGSQASTPQWAGADVTNLLADVLVFDGAPYFLTWTGSGSILVYASYLQTNRPPIPDESDKEGRLILPTLKCMFKLNADR